MVNIKVDNQNNVVMTKAEFLEILAHASLEMKVHGKELPIHFVTVDTPQCDGAACLQNCTFRATVERCKHGNK